MKFGPALAVVMSIALVAGCAASRRQFDKPGVTLEERKRDEAECAKRSVSMGGPWLGVGVYRIDRDAYQSCLKQRGYQEVRS